LQERIRSIYSLLIALVALLIAVVAWVNSREARELALSEIALEEGSSLTIPVYDESQGRYSFVALYEVHVENLGGAAVKLEWLSPGDGAAGFLVTLKDGQVAAASLDAFAFLVDQPLAEIEKDGKKLQAAFQNKMKEHTPLELTIAAAESRIVRFGVHLSPYDAQNKPLVDMALLSFRFMFDNGKSQIFRRGFPITPLMPAM